MALEELGAKTSRPMPRKVADAADREGTGYDPISASASST